MWLYHFNHFLAPAIGTYWRLGLSGETGGIPREGPLILIANHSSFLDPWFIGMAFPRPVHWLIDTEWFDSSPAYRSLFRAFGTVPVRARDPQATVDGVCELLARGEVVGVFPEGGVSPDGRIRRFRTGIYHMAGRSGAPVLPLGVRGAFESLPRSRRLPLPRRVTVHVGRPVVLEGAPYADAIPEQVANRFMRQIVEEVARLAGRDAPIVTGIGAPREKTGPALAGT